MTERRFTVPADTADPKAWIKGTAAEKAEAKRIRKANIDAWDAILSLPRLVAFEFTHGKTKLILAPSAYESGKWQLSYFDEKGAFGDSTFDITDTESPILGHGRKGLLLGLYQESEHNGAEVTALIDEEQEVA